MSVNIGTVLAIAKDMSDAQKAEGTKVQKAKVLPALTPMVPACEPEVLPFWRAVHNAIDADNEMCARAARGE